MAMLGPAVRTPSWHLSLKDIRWSRKEIRLRAKSICFPGKVVREKRKYIYLKDNYTVIKMLCQEMAT